MPTRFFIKNTGLNNTIRADNGSQRYTLIENPPAAFNAGLHSDFSPGNRSFPEDA
jgi:hypothetical protein